MQLQEVVTRNPETVRPDDSIRDATLIMRDCRVGFLPVVEDGKILGVVTDRDIVVRGIAAGYDPRTTSVRQVMTKNPVQLQGTDALETAIETMADREIARVIVTDRNGQMLGVLSSGDAATLCRGDGRAGQLAVAIHKRASRQTKAPQEAQFASD